MNRLRAASAVVLVAVGAALVVPTVAPGLLAGGDYERTTVVAYDDNGTELATVHVRVADTYAKRYTGLSDTETLARNEGMLFVHDREARHTYVMRDMAFPLDIVFVDANGTVTTIHHAELPPPGTSDGELAPYPGRGKYVLEVRYGWTNRTGVDVGDRIVVAGEY